jgi:hypothetical protein
MFKSIKSSMARRRKAREEGLILANRKNGPNAFNGLTGKYTKHNVYRRGPYRYIIKVNSNGKATLSPVEWSYDYQEYVFLKGGNNNRPVNATPNNAALRQAQTRLAQRGFMPRSG